MALPSNFSTSQITKSERWLKLYRTIHHLFLKDEFIHVADYNQMVTEMNTRITELETKLTVELTKLALGLSTHIHMAPQAPAGTLPTTPPTAPLPVYSPGLSPTKPVVPVTTGMQTADSALMATGPAVAPLSEGMSAQEISANTTIISDIGV